MKKIGLIFATVAAILFIAGCADQTPTTKAPYKAKHRMYRSKLGKISTKRDTKK